MSITVTPEELEQFRSTFSSLPEALKALTEIEDCDGDLEDASIALAIQVGQEPETNERWIDSTAKRWRHIICQSEQKAAFETDLTAAGLVALAEQTKLPLKLATPIAIYVFKTGVENFCEPYEQAFEATIRAE